MKAEIRKIHYSEIHYSKIHDFIDQLRIGKTTYEKPVQRQEGGVDCGLFAIAFAYIISDGRNPSYVRLTQGSMRTNLDLCFKNNILSPFPEGKLLSNLIL